MVRKKLRFANLDIEASRNLDLHKYLMNQNHKNILVLVTPHNLSPYHQDQSTNKFLARGHLAPNGDFIFYSWMDSSFHFINVAPQWQCFNGSNLLQIICCWNIVIPGFNWNYFESSCRNFAVERELDLVVYTGTIGCVQNFKNLENLPLIVATRGYCC